jgi:hypothetical protein
MKIVEQNINGEAAHEHVFSRITVNACLW